MKHISSYYLCALICAISFTVNAAPAPEIDEDYGRTLPFFGDRVRDMGITLPKPIGISLFTHQQEDLMHLGDFKVDGESVNDLLPNGESQTTNMTSIVALRGDVWILPFWGVNAMIGKAVTSSNISLGLADFQNGNLSKLEVNGLATTSTITALGTSLAFGHRNMFATVDAQYIQTSVSGVGVSLDALVITPLVGLNIGETGWRVVIGGQYQDYQKKLRGDLGDIKFSATQTSSRWSTMVGMQKEFVDNWEASVMMQDGKTRQGVTFMLGKRF